MGLSWPWWRRRTPGRHELGAAVTAIPSAAMRAVSPPPAAVRSYAEPPADLVRSARPMVSLGFRDGSTATLDPASRQARALQQLASSLTSTD